MNWISFAGIGAGAALGAWMRWMLGLWLNPIFAVVPLGTLAANLLGGYLVGVAVMLFHINTSLPVELRLVLVTGFLGGLTTFSTFSAEIVQHLARQQYGSALVGVVAHLFGALLLTTLGLCTYRLLRLGA